MFSMNLSQKRVAFLLLLVILPSVAMSQASSVPYMTSPRWSPDGISAAVAIDNTVEVWDAATEQKLYTLRGHTDSVFAVVWSPDSRMLTTGSLDGTVKVWAATDGNLQHNLTDHQAPVTCHIHAGRQRGSRG
jgi:WD40 repeat protein